MKGTIYYEAIATAIFSYVKISSFRVKAHLIFHWCLYNKFSIIISFFTSGVHCTHGFNRTGFLIIAYLVEKDDWGLVVQT